MCCFDCELMPKLQHIRVAGAFFADFHIPGKKWQDFNIKLYIQNIYWSIILFRSRHFIRLILYLSIISNVRSYINSVSNIVEDPRIGEFSKQMFKFSALLYWSAPSFGFNLRSMFWVTKCFEIINLKIESWNLRTLPTFAWNYSNNSSLGGTEFVKK